MPRVRSVATTALHPYSETAPTVHAALESLRHAKQQHERAINMLKRQQQRHAAEQRRAQDEARFSESHLMDDAMSSVMSNDALSRTLHSSAMSLLEAPTPQFSTTPVSQPALELLGEDLRQVLENVGQLEQVVDRLQHECDEEKQVRLSLSDQLAAVQADRDALVDQMTVLVKNAEMSAGVVERELSILETQLLATREQNAFLAVQLQQQKQQQAAAAAAASTASITSPSHSMVSPTPSVSIASPLGAVTRSRLAASDVASGLYPLRDDGLASRYTVKTRF